MDLNFPKKEKEILKFWQKNRIFEKSIEKKKKAKDFVFYEGPPTANARPGLHHVLARIYKDIICRYKTMRGFRVLRKAGWDTHGLPVELEIEKKLRLKSKKEIEKYGIAKFNKKCKESVWTYKADWEKLTERIAFWLDMENPYITYETDYIETLWWIIKQIHQKGLLYQDYKVVPYCSRCGTSLSSHEVALGYKHIKEPAIYVKFKLKPAKSWELKPESYLLVWTTTPWTLPGNVAIAVNPEFTYLKVKVNNEYLILAKERMEASRVKGKIIEELKGKDLIGLKYVPLFPTKNFHALEHGRKIYEVIGADFVSLEEGTGLVHIAPAFGEEDMIAGKENNLPILLNVDEEGKFKLEVKNWAGKYVKEADPLIIKDLKERELLFKEELYEHDYPFCWRCDSPLLYYAKQSWFINMQKVKKDLIKNNQKINWIPAHLKEGRFGEWLREIKDWAISRERYWGTSLPIWRCKKCGNLEVIGSKKDLIKQKFTTNKYFILRHGQTPYQLKKEEMTYPWPEITPLFLTKKGKEQIKAIAKKLKNKKIDLIYSSDITRASQTAEIVAREIGLKVNFDKRLRDVNLGIYQGRLKKDFYHDFPDPKKRFSKRPKTGENWNDVKKRMLNFIKDIDKKYKGKTILIVSHGDPLWLLEGVMKGLNNEELLEQMFVKKTYIKIGELRKIDFKNLPYNKEGELDFHRPYIDKVKFFCPRCQSLMKRVSEVIDCWFDSGSMPFAQYHYPFENKKLITAKKQFPADYISEGVDQTRGWFYTLLAISTLLGFGTPYKNVISLGHVLDEKGEKMSKSKGNVVDPWYICEKYGSDAIRWYFFTVNQPGDPKLFSEKEVIECLKRFIMTLWNSYLFFKLYGGEVGSDISNNILDYNPPPTHQGRVLDRWIISKLNKLIQQVSENLDKYNVTFAAGRIENFVIEDLSQWYIRRSRRRFQKPETKKELKEASATLNFVLLTLSKLTAPFLPFLSEEIYKNLQERIGIWMRSQSFSNTSVHLGEWPKVNKKLIDDKLEKKMEKVREIISFALAERAKAKIKVRQPLNELRIANYELQREKELLELIKEEVNVKKIVFAPKIKKEVELDTKITPELKEEGIAREVIRQIQEMRKKAKLKPQHKILISYSGTTNLNEILLNNKTFILRETKAKDFLFLAERPKQVFDVEKEVKIDGENLWLRIRKL